MPGLQQHRQGRWEFLLMAGTFLVFQISISILAGIWMYMGGFM